MEANQIKDLMEAYASVYAQPEEEEVLDEDLQGNVKAALEKGAEFMKKNPVGRAVGAVLQPVGKGRGTVTKAEQESKVKGNVKEEADIFDVILEYLITEGYADTNQAALVIMANMSEQWKQSIVEGGINFSVPSRTDDFNNRRDELKNRYKQDVGPRIPGPSGGGQYGEPAAPKAMGVRLARGTSSSKRGVESKNNA